MERKNLEQILAKEKDCRNENGAFGIKACKESIINSIELNKKLNEKSGKQIYNTSLYILLEEYVERANEDVFFNRAMVLACWELINEQ